MEFQTNRTTLTPKNLYPCTATITVVPHGTDTRARRLSAASFGSNSGGGAGDADADNGLKRVISGGRRKTSFGVVADRGDLADGARRRSFSGDGGSLNRDENNGKWYWRVQAGTVDGQLVLLPLTQPPNPVLTSPPQPLSHAMPAHSHAAQNGRAPGAGDSHAHGAEGEHEGIGTKIKNLFRRSSTLPEDKQHHDTAAAASADTTTGATGAGGTAVADPPINNGNDAMSQATATTATAVDRVLDQTAQGEMLPSAGANAIGATNLNANAENGWPGVIHGQHLQSVVVDLRALDKSKVTLGGGGKKEGSYVLVHISGAAHAGIEPVGQNHLSPPKSGTIKFEFDKDWIGGKGEAEVLHHYITTALENLPARSESGGGAGAGAGERGFPQAENFQLGSGHAHTTGGAPNVPSAGLNLGHEIPPEQKAF